MTDQSNVAVVLGVYDAFRRGDLAAILSTLDPQADLSYEAPASIPWAGQFRGSDGWTKFFQAIGGALDAITLTMEPFAAQGEHVAVAGRYQATVRKTGKRIDSPLVHLWTVRNGKIVACLELTNTASEVAATAS